LILAFKETSGRPEVSLRRRCEKRIHQDVACAGGGVLRHQNTKKSGTQAKQMPSQSWLREK
jgi:hypothetical protein